MSQRHSRLASRVAGPAARRVRLGVRWAGAVLILSLAAGCQPLPEIDLPWSEGSKSAAETPLEPDTVPVADKEMVRRAQRGLARLGYRPGPADGMPGPRTRGAVAKFQAESGMPADGRVSADLLAWIDSALRRREGGAAESVSEQTAAQSVDGRAVDGRVALNRSRLPRYRPGSIYVYSDGHVDRLTAVRGKTLRWTGADGRLVTAHQNFLLPPAHWKAGAEEGTADLSAKPDRLWPLESDAPTRFFADVTLRTGAEDSALVKYREDWTCGLAAGETAAVPAGRFATVKFVCARAAAGSRPALERVWLYAPEIGYYVRREEGPKGTGSKVELVAILPSTEGWPPIARAALDRAVQDALNDNADGKARSWRSSGLDTTVEITPTRSYEDAEGRSCRSYTQTWKRGKTRELYPATACRDAAGRWVIPGLEGDPQASVSISQR